MVYQEPPGAGVNALGLHRGGYKRGVITLVGVVGISGHVPTLVSGYCAMVPVSYVEMVSSTWKEVLSPGPGVPRAYVPSSELAS